MVRAVKQSLELVYMQTLRHLYDTETQITKSLAPLYESGLDPSFIAAIYKIENQSIAQIERLDDLFRILYQTPRGQASWVATALLREAWDATSKHNGCTECCAAALLALKRYELTLYETLLHWSERCDLVEVLPAIRKCIAEELLQTTILSSFAFEAHDEGPSLPYDPCHIH